MSEFRVKVTVRNNLLLSAMEAAGYVGYGSLRRFARDAGVDHRQLSLMLSMKTTVLTKDGEFSVMAKALMEALGAAPSDLWTEQQLTMCLERNGAEFVMSQGDMNRMIAEAQCERLEDSSVDPAESTRQRMVSRILETNLSAMLSKKEELVLRLRFGVGVDGERTLEQCAKALDVTRERIRQIEAGALRKLKLKLEVGPSELALAADEFGL